MRSVPAEGSGLRGNVTGPETTRVTPEIQFAKSGDVHIAYQVVGDGPVDLVWIADWLWNLELQWEQPIVARFLERLASFSRLLLFDKRGSGLSDRTVDPDLFTLEVRIDDVRAVMDAARSEQAYVLGAGDDGASIAAVFGATVLERTPWPAAVRVPRERDQVRRLPVGVRPQCPRRLGQRDGDLLGIGRLRSPVAPEPRAVRRARRERRPVVLADAPADRESGDRVRVRAATVALDLRGMLSAIHVPTLVLHRTGDPDIPLEAGRDLAERIPGARFVALPGGDALPWAGDQDALLDEVEAFVTGSRPSGGDASGTRHRAVHRHRRLDREGGGARRRAVEGSPRRARCRGPSSARGTSRDRDRPDG